jgi:hypothetical protein
MTCKFTGRPRRTGKGRLEQRLRVNRKRPAGRLLREERALLARLEIAR